MPRTNLRGQPAILMFIATLSLILAPNTTGIKRNTPLGHCERKKPEKNASRKTSDK